MLYTAGFGGAKRKIRYRANTNRTTHVAITWKAVATGDSCGISNCERCVYATEVITMGNVNAEKLG